MTVFERFRHLKGPAMDPELQEVMDQMNLPRESALEMVEVGGLPAEWICLALCLEGARASWIEMREQAGLN